MILDPFIVHRAAAPNGPVQRCQVCEHTLVDNTPWYTGRVMVAESSTSTGPDGPRWYPADTLVATSSGVGMPRMTYLVDGRPLDPDERLCGGEV